MPTSFSYHPKRTVQGVKLTPDMLSSPVSMASGGFATIWRAGAHGEYAIKCFNNGGMAAAEEEFETLLLLSGQPVVPQVYGLGTFFDGMEKGYAAIVEEYVDGFTLANALKRGLLTGSARLPMLDAKRTLIIATQIALALQRLEEAGVSHRDLSANNVVLRRDCIDRRLERGVQLALIDFGQSTPVSRPSVTPSFRARLATVPYGAPEMYGGEYWSMRNSCKCDIWSFGAICVTMLAGEYWPEEISDLTTGLSSSEDLQRIAYAKREPLDLIALLQRAKRPIGDAEKRLAHVVSMCTNYDPNVRPTASELVEILRRLAPGNTPPTPPQPPKPIDPDARPTIRYGQTVSTSRPKSTVRSDFHIEGSTLIRYVGSQSEVAIPEGITSIGAHAFGGVTNLERVLLPGTVRVIGDYAFEGCSSLCGIAIASVARVGVGAFIGCERLVSITVRDPVPVIPNYAFKDCRSLEWVQLPSTLRAIGQEAFAGCVSLKQIDLPTSVERIGERAFYGCASLKRAVIPSPTVEIGMDAFQTGARTRYLGTVVVEEEESIVRRRVLFIALGITVFLMFAACLAFALGLLPGQRRSSSVDSGGEEQMASYFVTLADDKVCLIEGLRGSANYQGDNVTYMLFVTNRCDESVHVGVAKAAKGEDDGELSMDADAHGENSGTLSFPDKGDDHVYKATIEVKIGEKVVGTYAFDSSALDA